MLVINNLTKRYGKNVTAVDGLNLTVKPGEIYGFIGHNGAGKSTTIKAVVGALGFEEGDILIDGKSIKNNPIECKQVTAYVPDNPDIYDHLTGIQYLNFVCDIFGVDKEERKLKISEYADNTFYECTNSGLLNYAYYSWGIGHTFKTSTIYAYENQNYLI